MKKLLSKQIALLTFAISTSAHAEFGINLGYEGGFLWESSNIAKIPGNTGTEIDINQDRSQNAQGYSQRIMAAYKFHPKHEVRALWAPLKISGPITPSKTFDFQGTSFSVNTPLQSFYKFNSYRLSYIYHFNTLYSWDYSLGLTLNIRDAEIKFSEIQGNKSASKSNVGLVPLIHLEGQRHFNENWALRFELDGIVAKQGRAFDLTLQLQRYITLFGAGHVLYAYAGYRTIEGGVNTDKVYNFAWFQNAILGLRAHF